MIHKQRRIWCLLMAVILAGTLILSGCQERPNTESTTEPEAEDGEELWVMFGCDSTGYPSGTRRQEVISLFAQAYPNVTIRMEKVPEAEEELQRLRTQIMAGKGPDILLMSENDSLITDPYRAMANGLFADISEYYDADTDLQKEELNAQIMDAGVHDGRRYILPFSYDMPIAYVDIEQFETQGGNLDMFDGGILSLYESIFAVGEAKLATGVSISIPSQKYHGFNFLPEFYDYEDQEVLIAQEDIAQLLQAIQTARAAETGNRFDLPNPEVIRWPDLDNIDAYGENWRNYTSLYVGTMTEDIINTAFQKLSGVEIAAIPVAAADGDLVADVLFYGAIGAGCENTELAYEFLRLFLLGEWQWNSAIALRGAVANGWPVRTQGSAAALANSEDTARVINRFAVLYNEAHLPEITDEDIPFLNAKIDRVQFYTSLESKFSDMIDTLNDSATDEATDVDIDAMAAEFWDELYWYLYES